MVITVFFVFEIVKKAKDIAARNAATSQTAKVIATGHGEYLAKTEKT